MIRLQKFLPLALALVLPLAANAQHNISTVAGGGITGVPALSPNTSIGGPEAVVKDAAGNTYILDNFVSRIFKVDTSGNLTIFAGNGTPGFSGDGGPANKAQLNNPSDMCIDTAGNIYVADSDNSVIRKIATDAQHTITTVAGVAGIWDYNGDGIPATTAYLNVPDGVSVDSTGNIFIGDRFNHIVRKVTPGGTITTFAGKAPVGGVRFPGFSGDGTSAVGAQLHDPWGVFVDKNGNLFIADSTNHVIRKVTAGIITTFAGTPGVTGFVTGDAGPATAAKLNTPHGVFVDGSLNLFISDHENHAVREVPAVTTVTPPRTAGHMYTIAGSGSKGYAGDSGSATSAKLAHPSNVLVDASGNVFIADTDSDALREVPAVSTAGPPPMTAFFIYTLAGNGHPFWGGDGGAPTNGELGFQAGVASDGSGNIFIADTLSDVIREVSGGAIQTVAGIPNFDGYNQDGALAINSAVNVPNGVFVDNSGNLFIADTGNCLIREVSAGSISTVAGSVPNPNTNPPSCGFSGEGLLATNAQLNAPNSVFVDGSGNIFIADTGNHVIREVATTGIIQTVAGTAQKAGYNAADEGAVATTALLNHPDGIFVDAFGNLFIADTNNYIIREVPALNGNGMIAGHIYTVAGIPQSAGYNGDGVATSINLSSPTSVLVDAAGNIFIADSGTFNPNNGNHIIREVVAATGKIQTVAGTPQTPGFSGDGGPATSAKLNAPQSIAFDPSGNLLIADENNVRIRSVANLAVNPGISYAPSSLTFSVQTNGTSSAAQPVVVINTLNGALAINSIAVTGDFIETDNCGTSLAKGSSCTINVTFKPTASGTRNGSLKLTDGATNSPQVISLTGTGGAPTADLTATSLAFSTTQLVGTPSAAQSVTLTNNGTVPLAVASIQVTGTNTGDFSETDNCGTSVAAGGTCSISVTFKPATTGAKTASITITDNAGAVAGSKQTISLTGTGVAPAVSLGGKTSLTFATQLVGSLSAAQTVTLTNNGTAQLNIASIAASGDFAKANTSTCVVGPLPANANCTIDVTFTPTLTGARNGTLTITDDANNVPGSIQTVSLTGTGGTPTATLSGASLTFNGQLVGTPSTAQTVTLTNNGNIALGVTGIAVSGTNGGDFSETDNCGTSVAASGNCTISVTFKPATIGAKTASITITDNAGAVAGSTQTISLSGTGGTPTADLSGASLTFGNQVVSTPSAAQTVTLTNNGNVALGITGIAVSGTNSGDFAQTNTCGSSVAVGANCTISITFTPGASGTRTASMTITDNATGSPQSISLTGTGLAPAASLSGTSLSFTTQLVGVASTAQTVTLTNSGSSTLNITSIAVGGSNAGDFAQTNTCGTSVAAGAKCTISVTFTPGSSGTRAASITITDNAAGSPHSVSLSGMGMAISLALATNGSNTQTVKAGQTATYSLQLSATGGTATDQASVTITCTGAPALSTCNAPAAAVVVTPAAAAPVSITVNTTAGSMLVPGTQSEPKMQLPTAMRILPLVVLALLLCIAAFLAWMQSPAGRVRTVRMAFSVCLVLLPISAATLMMGCASGGSSPVHTVGTAAGTYTLTVTAAVSGKTQSTQLTLVVQ
jgi:trimeric autotransporter adhesin